MADAIDRDQMRGKIQRMADRCKQRRDGAYKVGYSDACKDAMQKLYECTSLETATRQSEPDDYCNFGEPEE